MLRQMKVGEGAVAKAVRLSHEQHHQLACSAVYENLHGKPLQVTAPHQYFAEIRKHHKEASEDKVGLDGFTAQPQI